MDEIMQGIVLYTGRAVRSHAKSRDGGLPKDQRDFHAGRRESYLQEVARLMGKAVKEIRGTVLGSDVSNDVIEPKTTSTCCRGTGMADYAAVPCNNPNCPVPLP